MSKSFALLRTNIGLTTNIKIVISKDYKLSLDSIESDMNLSYDRFKNVSFNKSNYYDDLISEGFLSDNANDTNSVESKVDAYLSTIYSEYSFILFLLKGNNYDKK